MPLTTGTCSLLTRSGIDVVRNKIKVFAQKKVSLPPNRHKIIILDEADSMTPGAQQALRRTMEIYAPTTRFCFACNQSNKIIEPIQSRCAILRFGRVSDEEVLRRLLEICEAEKVQYSDEGLAAVVFTAEGDMRQAINNLQSTWTGLGFVSPDHVFQVCDQPHPLVVREILEHCHAGRVDEALDKLDEVWELGYSCLDIVTTLFRVVKTMDSLPESVQLDFIRVRRMHSPQAIGWTHMRTLEGVATHLQLSGLIARLSQTVRGPCFPRRWIPPPCRYRCHGLRYAEGDTGPPTRARSSALSCRSLRCSSLSRRSIFSVLRTNCTAVR